MKKNLKSANFKIWLVPILLLAVAIFSIVLPMCFMFANLKFQNIKSVLSNMKFAQSALNSVIASFLTTVISVVLAFRLSWCMQRRKIRAKNLFRVLISLPMLIPSVSIGMGVVLLFGNNGIITNLLKISSGGVYGLLGIVLASVLYTLPVAFLMIDNILRYEDSSQYDAANVLGIPKFHRFFAITLPYMKKPLIATAFSVFTMSFTDYGVPLMVGGMFKTLPVVLYEEVIGRLDFGRGCVYGIFLLLPAVLAFILDVLNRKNSQNSFVSQKFLIEKNPKKDISAQIYVVIIAIFCVLPILSFLTLAFMKHYPFDMTLTFANVKKTFVQNGGDYLLNSVIIATLVSIFGVIFSTVISYVTARTKWHFSKILHLIGMASAAVPGIVLGLAYVLCFKGSIIYGTLWIMVMVNIVHFFATPYLNAYTVFSKVNENLEAVSATLGISRLRLFCGILVPQCKQTILEMFSYFFINSMMTISAVSFLANAKTRPMALMINQFEALSKLECAAVVSLCILIINVIVKLLCERKSTASSV